MHKTLVFLLHIRYNSIIMVIIKIYEICPGNAPYLQWLENLDISEQAIIEKRIARIRLGNFGDCTTYPKWDGMWEIRIDHGPGYRIYFGKIRFDFMIILLGGTKRTQKRDVKKAQQLWQYYKESSNE